VRPLTLPSQSGLPIPRKSVANSLWLNSAGSSQFGSISSTLSSPASSTTPMSSAGSSRSSKGSVGHPQPPYQVVDIELFQNFLHDDHSPLWFQQGGHEPFSIQQYHMQHSAKTQRRILHPGHQIVGHGVCSQGFLIDKPLIHRTANLLNTPIQMELPIGPKSHSGPTLLNVFSNAVSNTTVSCKVKVEPLLDTFLGPPAEVLQHHQDTDTATPFYGTL
jgi:hypothetical protein